MDYKGFNIAIHELGHNVEQVFSMSRIDHTLLEGVPNTGFTEAFAFLFQARDLELLGQSKADPQAAALQDHRSLLVHLRDRRGGASGHRRSGTGSTTTPRPLPRSYGAPW